MPLDERDTQTDYTVTLDPGESEVIKVWAKISTVIVELVFPDGTGSGEVYSSIDSNDVLDAILDGGDPLEANWTVWPIGIVTEASADKLMVGDAPNGLRFVNLDPTNRLTVLYRGNY